MSRAVPKAHLTSRNHHLRCLARFGLAGFVGGNDLDAEGNGGVAEWRGTGVLELWRDGVVLPRRPARRCTGIKHEIACWVHGKSLVFIALFC